MMIFVIKNKIRLTKEESRCLVSVQLSFVFVGEWSFESSNLNEDPERYRNISEDS